MKLSKFAPATLAVLLLAAPALAAEKLAPGKPAGAKEAAMAVELGPFLYIGLFAGVAALIAVTAGQGGTDGITTPTTTGTAP